MDWMYGLMSFWAILWTLAAVFIITVCIEFESAKAATLVVLVAVALPWALGYSGNPFQWVSDNPVNAIGLGVLYVCIGVLWALLVKWRLYIHDHRNEARERYQIFYGLPGKWTGELKSGSPTFEQFVERSSENPLHPSKHKERIIRWMAWWPFSVLSTVLSDFVARVWRRLYSLMESAFMAVMRSGVK